MFRFLLNFIPSATTMPDDNNIKWMPITLLLRHLYRFNDHPQHFFGAVGKTDAPKEESTNGTRIQ
jgi:hypothetical protein